MATKIVEFRTDGRFVRRARELRTLETMIGMYCRHHHGGAALCAACADLAEYARRRLERVREVMRWAGPRVLLRHPVLGVLHLLDGRRPAPRLPARTCAKPFSGR